MTALLPLGLEVPYKLLKIHGFLHNWSQIKMERIINYAELIGLSIMIHTGGKKVSEAYNYAKLCKKFPNVKFILAHGRPIEHAIRLLTELDNTYVDTAFMSYEDINLLITCGFENKILFGSDYPVIQNFRPNIKLIVWYGNLIIEMKKTFGHKCFEKITSDNFKLIPNIF
jgi:predicted TIM-barrel fold metal-dependent hydrolase